MIKYGFLQNNFNINLFDKSHSKTHVMMRFSICAWVPLSLFKRIEMGSKKDKTLKKYIKFEKN